MKTIVFLFALMYFFRIVVVINSLGLLIVILFSFQRPSHFNFIRYCASLVYHILCYTVNYFFKLFILFFVVRSNLFLTRNVFYFTLFFIRCQLFFYIFFSFLSSLKKKYGLF